MRSKFISGHQSRVLLSGYPASFLLLSLSKYVGCATAPIKSDFVCISNCFLYFVFLYLSLLLWRRQNPLAGAGPAAASRSRQLLLRRRAPTVAAVAEP